jgi:hypothetical protein
LNHQHVKEANGFLRIDREINYPVFKKKSIERPVAKRTNYPKRVSSAIPPLAEEKQKIYIINGRPKESKETNQPKLTGKKTALHRGFAYYAGMNLLYGVFWYQQGLANSRLALVT